MLTAKKLLEKLRKDRKNYTKAINNLNQLINRIDLYIKQLEYVKKKKKLIKS